MMTTLKKPQLRGAGMRWWKRAGASSIVIACSYALWYKVRIMEKRKAHYKEFYENWDDNKEFEAMRKAGIFKGFEPS